MINPKNHKITICGLQESGKTYYSKELIKRNRMRVLVVTPHKHDFEREPDNFYVFKEFGAQYMDRIFGKAKDLCKKGLFDGLLIDEFDVLFRNNFDVTEIGSDIFANHRHYQMMLAGITRRPQDIPPYFFESCKFIVSFALQGENVRNKFNRLYKGMGDDILNLNYETHEYLMKEIAKPPKKMPKL